MAKNREKYITERIRLTKIIPGGQALGTLENGKKVFLWGALPGETVTKSRITKDKSSYAEGIVEEVTDLSPERVAPRDEYYLANSPWQIFNFAYENRQKRELVMEVLRQQKVDLGSVLVQPTVTDGQEYFYRNKMEYSLYYDIEKATIFPAIRMRGSHRKIPVLSSSLERSAIWQRVQEIVAQLNAEQADARKYQSILLRCNRQDEVSGGLLENYQPHPQFTLLQETVLGRTYNLSPNGFFQINVPVYEMVLQEMQKWVETEQVLDLYAGVGTIGLSVARERQLTLVECDKSAYRELAENCKGTTARPILAKSEDALEYIEPEQTVILDPPRAGCWPSVIEKLCAVQPARIIYLSCNPITQARDVASLLDKYRICQIQPYNFFPHTPHIENLIILERKEPK